MLPNDRPDANLIFSLRLPLVTNHSFTYSLPDSVLMTTPESFASLPDTARLWIHAAADPLSAADENAVRQEMDAFMDDWSSHGRAVRGALHIQDQRFILIAATLDDGDVSGCGIDASVHAIENVASARGIHWVPALHVLYRDADGTVQHVSRSAFRALADEGTVTASTPVFDPSITTVEALRAGQFEQPAGDAWHARAFDLPHPA